MSDCPGAQWNYWNAHGKVKAPELGKKGPGKNGFNGKPPLHEKAETLDEKVQEMIKKYKKETGRPPSEIMIDLLYMMAALSNDGKQL